MAEDTFIYSSNWPHQTLDPPTWFYTSRAFDEDLRNTILHKSVENMLDIQPAMNADSQTKGDYTKAASVEDTPRGRGTTVNADEIEIAISNVEDESYTLSNCYPYQNAPLYKVGEKKTSAEHMWTESHDGINEEEPSMSCPWHLWELDIEFGEHGVSGKCIGTSDAEAVDSDVYARI